MPSLQNSAGSGKAAKFVQANPLGPMADPFAGMVCIFFKNIFLLFVPFDLIFSLLIKISLCSHFQCCLCTMYPNREPIKMNEYNKYFKIMLLFVG